MNSTPTHALRERLPRLSPVWLIPLATLLIGLWLAFDHLASQGPTITLKLEDAEGIEAGKTPIKTRSVQIGTVEAVTLSEDLRHTVITARMQDDAERMLNEGTRFWVVKPRIGREGISGLNTVLSGAYIELMPGDGDGKQREFTVEDQPPVTEAGAKGLYLTLHSDPGNSVSTGDPVTFRNLTVGRVVDTEFIAEHLSIRHRVFIEQPYDVLVTDTSRFWNVSGVDFQLDSQGFQVNLQSLETLLGGGIAFGVPDATMPAGRPAREDDEFTLHADQEAARRGLFDQYLEYVLLVEDTVRGLSVGAPVEYRGVRVGTVEQVPWRFTGEQPDSLTRFSIPVLIRIEPQRIADGSEVLLDDWRERLEGMFSGGLRATLKAGNLFTGALFVDLNFRNDVPAYQPTRFEGVAVFPTTDSGLARIENQITALLQTLNDLPLRQIADGLDRNLDASRKTLERITTTAERLETLLSDPQVGQLPTRLNDTLRALQSTLKSLSGEDGRQFSATLERLERVLRDAEPLLRTLREKPNALVFPRATPEDPLPRARDHDAE